MASHIKANKNRLPFGKKNRNDDDVFGSKNNQPHTQTHIHANTLTHSTLNSQMGENGKSEIKKKEGEERR